MVRYPSVVTSYTLVDYPRLKNLVSLMPNGAGAVAEVGVYRGGTACLLALIKGEQNMLYLFDTFEGMPQVGPADLHHKGDFADTRLGDVADRLSSLSGNVAANVRYGVGRFPATAPLVPEDAGFKLVHLDCDIYQSVRDGLEFFSPRMLPGGVIVLDDYNEPGCPGAKLAADEWSALTGKRVEPTCQSQAIIRY